jgi:hypothetical protein
MIIEKIAIFCNIPVNVQPITISANRHRVEDISKNSLSDLETLENDSLSCKIVVFITDEPLSICLIGACLRRLLEIPDIKSPFH